MQSILLFIITASFASEEHLHGIACVWNRGTALLIVPTDSTSHLGLGLIISGEEL